jgi:hypothetical protein
VTEEEILSWLDTVVYRLDENSARIDDVPMMLRRDFPEAFKNANK